MKRIQKLTGLCTAAVVGAIAIAPPSVASTFRDGWFYSIDAGYDSYGTVNGNIQVGGTIYEIYGMAIHENEETGEIWVGINSNMPITGNPTGSQLCVSSGTCYNIRNDSIAWGDMFFDFSGTGNFQQAFDSGQMLGVRFSPNNDSGVGTGVYRGVTGMNVSRYNAGFQNLYQYDQFAHNNGNLGNRDTWMGDLQWQDPYYGAYSTPGDWATNTNLMPNVIGSAAERVGDVTIRSQAELETEGFDLGFFFEQGANIFGFSFQKPAEMVGEFFATILQECINDGMTLLGKLTDSEPDPNPNPEPDPDPEPNTLCEQTLGQLHPLLPTAIDGDTKYFEAPLSHLWYDPDPAMGYNFQTMGNTLFTEILDFPCAVDFDDQFTVSVGDIPIPGVFGPGQGIDFSEYANLLGDLLIEDDNGVIGVNDFTVTDINPIDEDTPFLLQVGFNQENGEFTMTSFVQPVPEPSSIAGLLLVGIMGLGTRLLRRNKMK
ncbi:MAG: PEP-CTERM sorting domain-containing protein [Cyanobacteria bacterium SBLK]|nr:PEP-CTERM sorting domain-containing protein [Cyanobacteria bacterium SBLK]